MASVINTSACVTYKMFTALPEPMTKELQQIVFDYAKLGGIVNRHAAIVFCLDLHPWSLVLYSFAATIYIFGRLLLPFPSPKRMWIVARFIWVCISLPILIQIKLASSVIHHM